MYDAREKAIRDRKWELNSAFHDGKEEGEKGEVKGRIEFIRTLQQLLNLPLGDEVELLALPLEQLRVLTDSLKKHLRGRELK